MAFVAKASLGFPKEPKELKEAERTIIAQFRDVQAILDRLDTPADVVTELKAASYAAHVGELVRITPPAGGTLLILPPGTDANDSERVRVAIESVASGGSVTISVVGHQPINGADTLVLTTVGLTEIVSLGPTGWAAITASGGSGGLADGVYGSITVSGGGTVLQVTDGVYGSVTVSGGGATWRITDGVYGGVTVSGGGTVWTVTVAPAPTFADLMNANLRRALALRIGP